MARRERYTAAELCDAADECFGIKLLMKERLNCSYTTIETYEDKYPTVREAIRQGRRKLKSLAESKLLEGLKAGDKDLVKYILSNLNDDGTYSKKQETKVGMDDPSNNPTPALLGNERSRGLVIALFERLHLGGEPAGGLCAVGESGALASGAAPHALESGADASGGGENDAPHGDDAAPPFQE